MPSSFPYLPISTAVQETLQLNPNAAFTAVLQKHKTKFDSFSKSLQAYALNKNNNQCIKEKEEIREIVKKELSDKIIESSSKLMRRIIVQKISNSKEIQESLYSIADVFIAAIEHIIQQGVKDLHTNFVEEAAKIVCTKDPHSAGAIREAYKKDKQNYDEYFTKLHKELIGIKLETKLEPLELTGYALHNYLRSNQYNLKDISKRIDLFVTSLFKGIVEGISGSYNISLKLYDNKKNDIAKLAITSARVKSEMLPEELEVGTKLVGGCGIKLQHLTVQTSNVASRVLRTQWTKVHNAKPETWTEISYDNHSKGFAFRLVHENIPAWISDDYQWMESVLLTPPGVDADLTQERLAIQESMLSGKKEAYTKQIDTSKKLAAMSDLHKASLLHHAARLHDPFYLQALLAKNLSIETPDIHGYYPIHYAAMAGSLESLKALVQKGSSKGQVNLTSKNGSSPLIVAIQNGQKHIVRFLLANGAGPSLLLEGYNTLHCTLHHGDMEIINDVLANPAIVVSGINKLSDDGGSPLMLACELDSTDLVEKMIRLRADPNLKRKDGLTALDIAIQRDCVPVAVCLLKHSPPGEHSIETVAKKGSIEMLRLFVGRSAFYAHRNSYFDTVLHTAIRFGNIAGALFIINNSKDISFLISENSIEETAFSLAASFGAWEIIEELMKKKVVERDDIVGSLPSLLAIEYDQALKQLFEICNFNANELQHWALIAAQAGNHLALSDFFVSKQVPLEALIGINGWRIPHYLAKSDGLFLFRKLIGKDVLQPIKSEHGKTLPYIAGAHRSSRVLRVILEQMKKENTSLERHFKDRHLFYSVLEAASLKCVRLFFDTYSEWKKVLANTILDKSDLRPVHLASKVGALKILKLLVKEGADIKAADVNGDNALCHSLKADAEHIITYLLSEFGSEIISPRSLFIAASNDSKEHFNSQIKINNSQDKLDAALILAVLDSDTQAFQCLYKSGASINAVGADGSTPLLIASETGQCTILNVILKDKLLKHSTINGNNALHVAAKHKQIHCADMLLNAGYKNEANEKDKTALELSDNYVGLKIRLDSKEEYTKRVAGFVDLIMKANSENYDSVISKIKSAPLNEPIFVEIKGEEMWGTLFQIFLRVHGSAINKDIISPILQNKALDPNSSDNNGDSIAHLLLRVNILPMIKNPINWAKANNNGITPLHIAAAFASINTLLAVLAELKRLNLLHVIHAVDDNGQSPIFYAIALGKKRM